MTEEIWGYDPAHYTEGTDLTGYTVEATDGPIGKVDEATYEVGTAHLVVNCKPWLIGKHVLLPAGLVTGIDAKDETIRVGRSKAQIKGAPEYHHHSAPPRDVMGGPDASQSDVMGGPDAAYRDALGTYYGPNV
ncbi:PRC-barrel domain containing protein [Streptacidiphilus cavernicola]|uniref:PRC-barrel domain containing protein n=1 Tax=Streptacidiphilus cavernicola TaxID=3342716 RepID=A0ABV6VPY5_9ACTN